MAFSDARDPAIKLFGRTIQLPACAEVDQGGGPSDVAVPDHHEQLGKGGEFDGEAGVAGGCSDLLKDPEIEEDPKEEREAAPSIADALPIQAGAGAGSEAEAAATTTESENPKTPSLEKEARPLKPAEEEQSEANNNSNSNSNSKEKPALKKPDKILPCPRCNSLDTKFCYYNNYNVNQPRHFCKNCQRYWTAGGTMRNVPVGAGRRKNKNSGSHYRHLTLSDATARADHAEAIAHRMPLKPSGTTVLSFSTDAPLCESMSSVLNLAEKSMMKSCYGNGFMVQEEQSRGEQQSANSCVSASTNASEEGNNRVNLRDQTAAGSCYPGFAQIPCFPPAPWAYPWNPAQWRAPMPPPTAPPFCNSSFPVPAFFPAAAAYWGCAAAAPPGAWAGHVPWIPPPSPTAASCVSGSNSPTLGKHSREENAVKQCDGNDKEQDQSERCLWIPKTLRIDDPGEAAKSSIWATLGIRRDKCDGISGGGLFKAFPTDAEERSHTAGASQVLHANPAALSRSLTFHESSS